VYATFRQWYRLDVPPRMFQQRSHNDGECRGHYVSARKVQTFSASAIGARSLGHYMPLPTGCLFDVRSGELITMGRMKHSDDRIIELTFVRLSEFSEGNISIWLTCIAEEEERSGHYPVIPEINAKSDDDGYLFFTLTYDPLYSRLTNDAFLFTLYMVLCDLWNKVTSYVPAYRLPLPIPRPTHAHWIYRLAVKF
jgi:hypothetical protein